MIEFNNIFDIVIVTDTEIAIEMKEKNKNKFGGPQIVVKMIMIKSVCFKQDKQLSCFNCQQDNTVYGKPKNILHI